MNESEIKPQNSEVTNINFSTLSCTADARSRLTMVAFLGKFIDSFAQLSLPLLDLLKKGVSFDWVKDCDEYLHQ